LTTVELSVEELEATLLRRRQGQMFAEQAEQWGNDLRLYVKQGWHVVEPKHKYIHNWHIDAICDHVVAAYDRDILRLGIMVPPRTMKSLTVSVFAPTWQWIREPGEQFLTASYGADLSLGFATKSRDLIRSSWFQSRWGDKFQLKGDVNTKSRYQNTQGGQRLATSVGGIGTGEGGDIIQIDDPHNADEILSDTYRQAAIEWHDGTISTRFNQPDSGVEIIIMQRLHEKDVMGHVLELDGEDEWTILCLPEEYEKKHPFVCPPIVYLEDRELQGDPRTEDGELLFPKRIGPKAHEQRKRRLGSFRAAGQLQQRPSAHEGAILKRQYWKFFDPRLLETLHGLPNFTSLALSFDTSFKDKTSSDYVAGSVWGLTYGDRYLLRLINQRMTLSQTKTTIMEFRAWGLEKFPGCGISTLIEKSANGVEIIEQLQREIPGVVPVVASTDKTTRAWAAEPDIESGNVFLPGFPSPEGSGYDEARTPADVQELVEQCAKFPTGDHDDMVDMTTQLVNWARAGAPQQASVGVPMGMM
jgi:predicted phage terminase large subunit-like protein